MSSGDQKLSEAITKAIAVVAAIVVAIGTLIVYAIKGMLS